MLCLHAWRCGRVCGVQVEGAVYGGVHDGRCVHGCVCVCGLCVHAVFACAAGAVGFTGRCGVANFVVCVVFGVRVAVRVWRRGVCGPRACGVHGGRCGRVWLCACGGAVWPCVRVWTRARKGGPVAGPPFVVCRRRCPTLPHPGGCSTIGAGSLSFRVRKGKSPGVSLPLWPPPRLPGLIAGPPRGGCGIRVSHSGRVSF